MGDIGGGEDGIEMRQWKDWLALDISAYMTYNRQMNQMKDSMCSFAVTYITER